MPKDEQLSIDHTTDMNATVVSRCLSVGDTDSTKKSPNQDVTV